MNSKIFRLREEMYVNTHIRQANSLFGTFKLQNCYRLGWVEFWAEVSLAPESALSVGLVSVRLFLCLCSVIVESVQCDVGKKGLWPCGLDEA
jgi:hypothetical protein